MRCLTVGSSLRIGHLGFVIRHLFDILISTFVISQLSSYFDIRLWLNLPFVVALPTPM